MDISAKDILIPLLSALGAGFLTHWLTLRRSRADLLLKTRLDAFNAMHQKLCGIHRFCMAMAGEASGSEFSLTTEMLSESDNRSMLEHLHEFRWLYDGNFVYFPEKLRHVFLELEQCFRSMSNVQFQHSANPDSIPPDDGGGFINLAATVQSAINQLHAASPLS